MSGEVNLLFPNAGLGDMLKPATEGGLLFCSLNEAFAINGVTYKWPKGIVIKWHLGFSTLGSIGTQDLIDTAKANYDEISSVCDRQFEYTSNPKTANFLARAVPLDGPSGVLADHGIPMPGANENTQLPSRYDLEAYGIYEDEPPPGKIDWGRVHLHESLHGCGLGHAPFDRLNRCLIEANYNDHIRHLCARDIAELVRRDGLPKNIPDAPKPTTTGASKPVYCSIGPKGLRFWQDSSKTWGVDLPWKVQGEMTLTLERITK